MKPKAEIMAKLRKDRAAKGIETADYKMRRKWLELFWLPENLDHIYQVVKEKNTYKRRIQNAKHKH